MLLGVRVAPNYLRLAPAVFVAKKPEVFLDNKFTTMLSIASIRGL